MLTEIVHTGTSSRVGRKKEYPERITLPLAAGTTARLDEACADGEARVDLIRQAIEREIKRRARKG